MDLTFLESLEVDHTSVWIVVSRLTRKEGILNQLETSNKVVYSGESKTEVFAKCIDTIECSSRRLGPSLLCSHPAPCSGQMVAALQHFPASGVELVLELFNPCFGVQYFRRIWKTANICMVLKPC